MAGRLIVLDPGLYTAEGHHLGLDRLICDLARERGWEPLVVANRQWQGDTLEPMLAAFRTGVYGATLDLEPDVFCQVIAGWNRDFLADLIELDKQIQLDPQDRLLVHTLTSNVFLGLALFLGHLGTARPQVHLHFMLEPDFGAGNAGLRDIRAQVWWAAADIYKDLPGQRSQSAESAPILSLLNQHGISADLALVPARPYPPGAPTAPRSPKRFLWAGSIRSEKGFEHVAAAARLALERSSGATFRFRSPDLLAHCWSRLLPVHPRLSQDPGLLSESEYRRELSQSAFTFCFYEPSRYRFRNSNVFWEAIAAGSRPVICAGTAAADYCDRFSLRSPLIVPQFDPTTLADSIIAASDEQGPASAAVEADARVESRLRQRGIDLFVPICNRPADI